MATLESLRFDNLALRALPIDPEERNYVRTVYGACFSKVNPTPVDNPKLVAYSENAMSLLDLPLSELEREDFVEYFSGNRLLPESEPAAHCYCGHQFGYFAGQLGDGAAMYLGEVINSKSERWEIQLKGAGLTPYSRMADGRKVLRSSIREFLCSEAMYFLGIPTTRAGACITSDSEVMRDVFYDGNPKQEKCTIVLRIAPTFIRFGSFEIFKALDPLSGRVGTSIGNYELLHEYLDYVIETFFPQINPFLKEPLQRYLAFFKSVVVQTARLVAEWQAVGFCHGVLNTDNMSILGLTLDYGPFGFLDMYDPDHVSNASDDGGRYSFSRQVLTCNWNLERFAEAIEKVLPTTVTSTIINNTYEREYNSVYLKKMRKKLGLIKTELPEDKNLIEDLLNTMEKTGADYTNTFCCFHYIDVSDSEKMESSFRLAKEKILEQCYSLDVMLNACKAEINSPKARALLRLADSNPELYQNMINYDPTLRRVRLRTEKIKLLEKMTQEMKVQSDRNLWSRFLEKYKARLEKDKKFCACDLVSYNKQRLTIMQQNNPKFVLRNYLLQNAIDKAENGDYSEVRRLLKLVETPYDHSDVEETKNVSSEPVNMKNKESSNAHQTVKEEDEYKSQNIFDMAPEWGLTLKVT